MENYVVSYDLAVKLKELGLDRKSINFWGTGIGCKFVKQIKSVNKDIKAYMTDELLEMMPVIETDKFNYGILIFSNEKEVHYYDFILNSQLMCFKNDKIVNSLAKMLIWLIENDYVKVSDLNG